MFRPSLKSQEQLEAIKLFGSRVVVRDGVRLEEPAQGNRAIQGLLRVGAVEDRVAMKLILADAHVNGPGVRWFDERKVVVRRSPDDGGGLEVHTRIPGVTVDNLSEYADTEQDFGVFPDAEIVDDRSVVYKLNTIFTDVTLLDKLRLSSRRVQTAKRLAMSDPAAAASTLMEYLRANGFPNCRVTAGDYAKTDARAKQAIGELANTVVYKDTHAPAGVTPTSLRMTYDGFDLAKPQWTVTGPLKYASQVQAIYQLSIHYGPDRVLFMLGEETLRLGIEIYDEILHQHFNGQVHGYSSLSGIVPRETLFPEELTAEQKTRLMFAAKKVAPVRVGNAVIGSAVQVSDRHVILNEHTLVEAVDADTVPTLFGEPIVQSRSVGHDIAMVKRVGVAAQWVFREADVGERVVLCFSVGDRTEYSEVLRVLGVYQDSLKLSASDILRKGASGAAVVSLRDSALLGIFSTKRGASVMCASFTSASFGMVTDLESVASSSVADTVGVGSGNTTYEKMVRKGFLGFLEAINSATMSVHTRIGGNLELAGLMANVSGSWVTTVDPDIAQLYAVDARPLTFRSDGYGRFIEMTRSVVQQPLPNVRLAEPGERVFVFTKDGEDVAMSTVRIVTHCYADGRMFVVEDFGDSDVNMAGALIVAEKDAAVVGQYWTRDNDLFGATTVRCMPMMQLQSSSAVTLGVDVGLADALRDWIEGSEVLAEELSSYGAQVQRVVGGKVAHQRGMSLVDGALAVAAELRVQETDVLTALGWTASDTLCHRPVGASNVFDMCIGMAFLRDPARTVACLEGFTVTQPVARPFVLAGFPVSRPLSINTVTSAESPVLSVDRLRELEEKFDALTRMVVGTD